MYYNPVFLRGFASKPEQRGENDNDKYIVLIKSALKCCFVMKQVYLTYDHTWPLTSVRRAKCFIHFFLTYSHDLVSGYCAYLACHWRTLLLVNCYVLSGGMSGGIFSFHHHFHYWSRSLNLKTHTSLTFQFFDLNVLFITFT